MPRRLGILIDSSSLLRLVALERLTQPPHLRHFLTGHSLRFHTSRGRLKAEQQCWYSPAILLRLLRRHGTFTDLTAVDRIPEAFRLSN